MPPGLLTFLSSEYAMAVTLAGEKHGTSSQPLILILIITSLDGHKPPGLIEPFSPWVFHLRLGECPWEKEMTRQASTGAAGGQLAWTK